MQAATVVENPMRAWMGLERTAEPCAVVIFGASGDLAKRKLIPALYRLVQERLLPAEFAIIGLGRTAMTDEEFREKMKQAVLEFSEAKSVDEEVWQSFAGGMRFLPSNIDRPECYADLAKMLEQVDRERGTQGNRLFYLSVAPEFYAEAVKQLGEAGLTRQDKGWVRVVIEKPFGTSLESARELNRQILKHLDEKQIYRIDHYLGKETVQNLLVFRFANGIYEPLWNRQYIDHVQITNAETVGVEGRGGYYEKSGVVRDMIQNHVFQVLSLVAMVTMWFDNWRWSGVPFYIRSGKRLAKRVTEIAIQFKSAPLQLFGAAAIEQVPPNQLVIRIQPDEGITLRVAAKVPGQVTRIRDVNMDFRYGASFGVQLAEAYERLILDCILGDSTLYARKDMTERGWELVMPILDYWAEHKAEADFPNYEAGSWGPEESFNILEAQGRQWRRP